MNTGSKPARLIRLSDPLHAAKEKDSNDLKPRETQDCKADESNEYEQSAPSTVVFVYDSLLNVN